MIPLKLLIQYWQERCQPHPPITAHTWPDALTSTIHYLEELQRIKEATK